MCVCTILQHEATEAGSKQYLVIDLISLFNYLSIFYYYFTSLILCRCNLWNENSSLWNTFINWLGDNAQQGLYTESNRVGRAQDSRETEKERGREAEPCCEWEMAWAINLIVGENIYGRFGRVSETIKMPLMMCFPRLEYFLW